MSTVPSVPVVSAAAARGRKSPVQGPVEIIADNRLVSLVLGGKVFPHFRWECLLSRIRQGCGALWRPDCRVGARISQKMRSGGIFDGGRRLAWVKVVRMILILFILT